METVYKVQNMPLIVDNIIHVAVSEEVVELVDHHSVDVADLSVEVGVDTNETKTIVDLYFWGRGGAFDSGYSQTFGQPFDNYGPPPMAGRPPFARPGRGFGGPILRGIDRSNSLF